MDGNATIVGENTATQHLGPLRVMTKGGEASGVLKHPGGDSARIGVGTLSRGSAILSYGGKSAVCPRGALFVVDLAEPWRIGCSEDARLHVFLLPRVLFGRLTENDLGQMWGVHTTADHSVVDLLAPLLVAAAESAGTHPPHIGHGIAGSIVDLLCIVAAGTATGRGASDGERASGHGGMADRIRQFVSENLQDPALGPELVAERHRVSVRYVHKVFTTQGTTLSRWIRERRLHECRRELARAGGTGPAVPVSTVARRWGFTNASHFSRNFRARYGVSPVEWQRIRTGATVGGT
ncbi:Transcriptional activator NphR [Streptomyces sp. enrichment culture]|uniref:helix-turn-helix transcriptional regulator n=1 Tax=Streptomyces sp. enrichment culture TaxID=1795815 RepID=UPI003F56502F